MIYHEKQHAEELSSPPVPRRLPNRTPIATDEHSAPVLRISRSEFPEGPPGWGGCPSAPGNLSTGSKNPGNLSSGRRQAAEKILGIAQQKWDRLPEAVKTTDVVRL